MIYVASYIQEDALSYCQLFSLRYICTLYIWKNYMFIRLISLSVFVLTYTGLYTIYMEEFPCTFRLTSIFNLYLFHTLCWLCPQTFDRETYVSSSRCVLKVSSFELFSGTSLSDSDCSSTGATNEWGLSENDALNDVCIFIYANYKWKRFCAKFSLLTHTESKLSLLFFKTHTHTYTHVKLRHTHTQRERVNYLLPRCCTSSSSWRRCWTNWCQSVHRQPLESIYIYT